VTVIGFSLVRMPVLHRSKRDFLFWGESTECVSTDDTSCSDDHQADYLRSKLKEERAQATRHEESLVHESNTNKDSGDSTHIAFVDLENHSVGMQGWPVIAVVAVVSVLAVVWCFAGCCKRLAKAAGRAAGMAAGGAGAAASSAAALVSTPAKLARRQRRAGREARCPEETDSEGEERPPRKSRAVSDPKKAGPSPMDVAMAYAELRERDERAPAYGTWQPAKPGLSGAGRQRRYSLDESGRERQRYFTLEEARQQLAAEEKESQEGQQPSKGKGKRVHTGS